MSDRRTVTGGRGMAGERPLPDYRQWRTIVKLDPGKGLTAERLEEICSWPVDAVVVGGSGGYGAGDVLALLTRLRRWELPLALEVSDLSAVCPGFDLYLVPTVLNSTAVDWVVGHHHAAIKRLADRIDWERVIVEGYCILNRDATAARIAHARTGLDTADVVAFARMAECFFRLPVFYLEYSGIFGSPEVVRAVHRTLRETRLWYGGGIRTPEQVAAVRESADALVIGNAVYEGCSPLA